MGKRRSKKSLKGFRARRLGDVRHLAGCRERFGGPPVEGDFEAMVFIDGRALGKQLEFTNAERERYKVYTIKPIDKTDAELRALILAKKRESERLRRLERGVKARVPSEKPWLEEGISKSTWYMRHRIERGVPSSLRADTKQSDGHFLPLPNRITMHPVPPEPVAPPKGLQQEPDAGHEIGLATAAPVAPPQAIRKDERNGSATRREQKKRPWVKPTILAGPRRVGKGEAVGLGHLLWTKPTISDEALAPGLSVFPDRRARP